MPNEIDFLNDALGQGGLEAIASLNASSPNAQWCRTFYPQLRQMLIRLHHWNFATKRVALQQDITAPAFEFSFAYNLPPNCLKIVEYNGDQISVAAIDPWYRAANAGRYKIEGRQLLTNDGIVNIVYLEDTGPEKWDALFYQILAAWLSARLIAAIWKDGARAAAKLQEANNLLLPLGVSVDGQEGTPSQFVVDDLTAGR